MSHVMRMAIWGWVLATGFFTLAADVGWLQTGVRVWYVGGVNTDYRPKNQPPDPIDPVANPWHDPAKPPWVSDAEASALIDRVEGGVLHLVRHQSVRNWTSAMPVEDVPVADFASEGPFWMNPHRLNALRPAVDGVGWQGLQWLVSSRITYHSSDPLPFLNLFPMQALFLVQSQRDIVILDTVTKTVLTYDDGSVTNVSLATAFFEVATGLLLSRTDTAQNADGKSVRTILTLSEINYDFAARQAFAEDNGPHSGFCGFFSASRNEFLVNQSVQCVSVVVTRYKNALFANLSSDLGNAGVWPSSYHADNELFYDADPGSAAIQAAGSQTWQVNGDHLFWWMPPSHLGLKTIRVWNMPLDNAGVLDRHTTFTTTTTPADTAFTSLVFDAAGYLENMAVKVPAMGIEVDSRTGSARTMRIDGLAYYGSSMGGPVAPSGRPLVPNQFLITIPAGQNGRIAQDGFQFLLAGEAAFDYVSEVSEDLTLWLPLSTNRITDVRLPVTIHDRPAANLEKRFYRVRPLPALP